MATTRLELTDDVWVQVGDSGDNLVLQASKPIYFIFDTGSPTGTEGYLLEGRLTYSGVLLEDIYVMPTESDTYVFITTS